jgi:hypothetical protein
MPLQAATLAASRPIAAYLETLFIASTLFCVRQFHYHRASLQITGEIA